MADISITYRNGWALLSDVGSGRTALCIPSREEGPPERLVFEVVGWHDDYEDAIVLVAAMQSEGLSIDDIRALNAPDVEPQDEPPMIEGDVVTEPEPEPKPRRRRKPSLLATLFHWRTA